MTAPQPRFRPGSLWRTALHWRKAHEFAPVAHPLPQDFKMGFGVKNQGLAPVAPVFARPMCVMEEFLIDFENIHSCVLT